MGLFGKLFGGGASLEKLRKAIERKDFAEARLLAEQLSEQSLADAEAAELEPLRAAAGDGLARLNLDEALALERSGQSGQAQEHLQLALEQVVGSELRQQIEAALAAPVEADEIDAPAATTATACGSCGPQPASGLAASELELPDAESQLELVMAAYPAELGERYRQKTAAFLQALLYSHNGDDGAALPLWNKVPAADQDELYWFEFGAALAREGRLSEAREALEQSLQLNPGLLLATEALIPVLVAAGEIEPAKELLQQMLDQGQAPGFCHAQLTMICLQQEQTDEALLQTRKALAAGVGDPAFLLLAASLLEQTGALDEAEAVLRQMPAGGCGGGLSLPLAEFLLRQHRELDKVLDTFNGACRQEPDNPRWQLRVAQTYLARQWQKEGLALLRKVAADPRLDPELQQEAQQQLRAPEH